MATRPAPRKSTREERRFLADVRRAAKDNSISMTDVYNYERGKQQEFEQGLRNAGALDNSMNWQPTVSAEKITSTSAPADRAMLNLQQQGRSMEGLFGQQVNPFGGKVDPADARTYREMIGRNPLYKFTFDKGSQHESSAYQNIREPDRMVEFIKGIPTDIALSTDKLVRGISGDRADAAGLFTAGGRLANQGEFSYESRKGDKAGILDDLLNTANLASYAVGGSGIGLKGLSLGAKAVKAADAANTIGKAARMGRVTNTLDTVLPVAAQTAPMVAANPTAAGITGGTGAAILAGLLTKGKGLKATVPTAVATLGGATLASSAAPDEASAISFGANIKRALKSGAVEGIDKLQDLSPSQVRALLDDPKWGKWVISRSQTRTRRAAPSYDDNAAMRHWIANDPAARGLSYDIARKRWQSSAFKEGRQAYTNSLIEQGIMIPHTDQDLINKTKDLLDQFTDANGNWISDNARRTFFEGASGSVEGRNAFHLAHGTSIKKGGPLSPDNTYWKRGKANLKEGIGN